MAFEDKTKNMKDFINKITESMFGRNTEDSIKNNICVTCGAKINPTNGLAFKDELSFKEYLISGMCQECQDSVFGSKI